MFIFLIKKIFEIVYLGKKLIKIETVKGRYGSGKKEWRKKSIILQLLIFHK
jgi:hypothetical protein